MKSIDPIAPVAELLLRSSAVPAPAPMVTPELAQKFEALMARTETAGAPPVSGPNVVTDVMVRQEGMLKNVQDEVYGLMQAAPHMTASELGAATVAVSRNVAIGNFKLQTASSITSGSNKSLQTLLKNQ